MSHAHDLQFGFRLADAADAITLARFGAADLRVETKPDRSPVSEADRAVEQHLRDLLAQSGRGEGVHGEEFGDDGTDSAWIVDPIDGTTSYIRGVPIWATLLALQREGDVVVGIASAPALRRRWWAVRGGKLRRRQSGACVRDIRSGRRRACRLRRRAACRRAGARWYAARGRTAG